MRHGVDGRKLSRNSGHRQALFRNLANALLQKEQIVTTLPKAKEARRVAERLITLGKRGDLHARRLAFDRTRDSLTVERLFGTLADRYKARAGGYTRILRYGGLRRGDAAQMAVLELVDHPALDRKRKKTAASDEAASKTESTVKDPFKGVKKMFGGGRKKSDASSPRPDSKAKRGGPAGKTTAPRGGSRGSSGGE